MADGHRIEWGGFRLGDTGASDDLTVLGRTGLSLIAARDTVLTPLPGGGELRGASVQRSLEIDCPVKAKDRATLLSFIGAMAPIGATEETPLVMRGLIFGDPDDVDAAVQVWAGPEGAVPEVGAQNLGMDDWRCQAKWIASDPTIVSAAATVVGGATPAGSHSLLFTNAGNAPSPTGRAWEFTLTAAGTVKNPFVELGGHRVTWAGLTLTAGQTLVVDRHRHSRINSLGVDGFRTSDGTPNPDWPVFEVGANAFEAGASSGTFTCELQARSTWVVG